jgi:protein-S-isoprenylcysteine O-methyltransferase Ste14
VGKRGVAMWPEEAINIPWDVWLVSWIVAALWANRTLKRPTFGSEWPYRILEYGGFAVLLFTYSQDNYDFRRGFAAPNAFIQRYWALPLTASWVMVGLTALGFVFCWWARIHLGRLWSASVTRKENHRIIDTGPYALVRHPIYTGIILASVATTAVKGSGFAVAGLAIIVVGYWMKARLEERFLREELGARAYDAYARKTAMLIPFVRL